MKNLFDTILITAACVAIALCADTAKAEVQQTGHDTSLPPMFLMSTSDGMMQMVYWADIEEPQYTDDNAEYFEEMHQQWALQEKLRSNASQYTKLIVDGTKTRDVKYVDEILLNPDGEQLYLGQLHSRPQLQSPGARFYLLGKPALKDDELPGVILISDSYLATHKPMAIKPASEGEMLPLPANVIKRMEEKYGMKVEKSVKSCIIGDRYTYGVLQFQGAFKNPVQIVDSDIQAALALEIITDGKKIYSYPVEGYYFPDMGPTWHADDCGEYFPSHIAAAFDSPSGPEFYFVLRAPESATTGKFVITDDQLDCQKYAIYHALYDENLPVWKKDIEEMKRLYVAADPENKNVKLTKWAHVFIDYEGEQIWISDEAEENGAFFSREDGKLKLVGTTWSNLRPSFPESKSGNNYLMLSGPAGGPSFYYEIYKFKDGKMVEAFTAMEVYGEIDVCTLNGKPISTEEGKAYMKAVPEATEPFIFWTDINN